MFMMHISSLLACSVLLASTVLIIWSKRNKGVGSCLGKAVGSVVLILSALNILCIGYYGVKYWAQGHFERPMGMGMGMHKGMGMSMGMGMPMGTDMGLGIGMHKEMMEKMTGNMKEMGAPKEEDPAASPPK